MSLLYKQICMVRRLILELSSTAFFAAMMMMMMDGGVEEWGDEAVNTGTSIMAVEFPGGVVIGADSRTTIGSTIVNRVTDKLTKITDYIYCCRSGSAADTQAVADIVSYQLALHRMELQVGEVPLVSTGATMFRKVCYNYRKSLTVGILLAGWDHELGGQVYSIPVGGTCERTPVSIEGSGSTLILGYMDANYKPGMTKQQAMDFVVKSLALAMSRDGSSGGVIRLAAITKDGVERKITLGNSLPRFWEG